MNVRTIAGDTIDALAWRYYGRTDGLNELILEANQNLAALGPVLPVGTLVELPEAAAEQEQELIQLWD